MLQSIRDRLSGPVVWVVIGFLVVVFGIFGVGGIHDFRGRGDPVVVKVGDQEITQSQFRQTYGQRYNQYRSLVGDSFRADAFDEAKFRELALDDMVQEAAMRQYARSEGYRASDATMRDFLISVPAFQKDGKFSSDAYRELLKQQGMKPDSYEVQLREALAIDQLRATVQATAFVTPAQAWEAERLEKQVRRITVVPISTKKFRDQVTVTDAQIADRFETDKSRYQAPERVKLAYVEVDRKQLAVTEAPAPEVLKAIYDAEKEQRFSAGEERRASHILVAFGADKDQAKKKAEALLAKAKAGGDFAQLARESSDDTGSKGQGGDLGWVRKGMMAPKFEEVLYGISASGDVVGPVETEFGWHLIKLAEIKPAAIRPFEDAGVQVELLDVYRTREGEKRFQELTTKLEQLAFESTTLEPVATELKLEIKTTDWFTREGGTGIAAVEAVKKVAFSPELLEAGDNSKPIASSPDSLVVVRKAEYEPARQQPLEEVKDRVREALVVDGAAKLAKAAAEALVAQAKGGQSLREAAQAKSLDVQFDGPAARGQSELEGSVGDAVFRMPRPAQGAVHVEAVDNGNGGVSVVALEAVIDPPKPGDAQLATAGAALARARDSIAGAEFGAYRKAVEDAVKVKRVNAPDSKTDSPEP